MMAPEQAIKSCRYTLQDILPQPGMEMKDGPRDVGFRSKGNMYDGWLLKFIKVVDTHSRA